MTYKLNKFCTKGCGKVHDKYAKCSHCGSSFEVQEIVQEGPNNELPYHSPANKKAREEVKNTWVLTQEELKKRFHYDPDTGLFTRLTSTGPKAKVGEVVTTKKRNGYLQVGINYKSYTLHRLAFLYMEGELPPDDVDHINGVRDDNRWCNLRKATRSQNLKNSRRKGRKETGFPCVYQCTKPAFYGKFTVNGEMVKTKVCDTPEEAYEEYRKLTKKHHGEFAPDD